MAISHPDLASEALYATYDHAFVASDAFAAVMAKRSTVPVDPLHQATDPERFFPDPTGPRHELLFVANYRPNRPIVDWLLPTDRDLAVYGNGWDKHGMDARHHLGLHIPNEDLRHFYSSASIVLNDTWEDMRAAGFISNRIYDALACGAFVLSDDVAGLADEFDGGVAVYSDEAGLREAVERYLDAPALRRETAERGRSAVLERHTFERRAAALLAVIEPLLADRPAQLNRGVAVSDCSNGAPAVTSRSRTPALRSAASWLANGNAGVSDRNSGRRARPATPRSGSFSNARHIAPSSVANPSAEMSSVDRMFECQRREVLGPESVGQDQHPEGGHLERRVARVRRDHQRDADRRLAEERRIAVEVELADRSEDARPPRSMSGCD